MADIELNTITSGYNISKVNDNFETIEDELNNNVMKTDGSQVMTDYIDMNSNRIVNVADAVVDSDAANLGQVREYLEDISDVVSSYSELKAVARSLNVEDSQVIFSTDSTTVLDDVLYIYNASTQVTYGVPTLSTTGEVIVSVVGSELTTSTAEVYTLISLTSSDTTLYVHDVMRLNNYTFCEALQYCVTEAEAIADTTTSFSKGAVKIVCPGGIQEWNEPILVYNPDFLHVDFENTMAVLSGELVPTLTSEWTDLPDDYSVCRGMFIVAKRRQTGGKDGVFIPGGANSAARYMSFTGSLSVNGVAAPKLNNFIDSYGFSLSRFNMLFYATGIKRMIESNGEKVYRIDNSGLIEIENSVGLESSGGGTTRNWNDTGLSRCDEGYKLNNVSYSQFSNNGCDSWGYGEYGWDFEDCLNVTLVGCGMEKGYGGAYRFSGERCSVNLIGCNIASGALPRADNWSGSDDTVGQTTAADFGVDDFAIIEGASVVFGDGCSIRQEYSTQTLTEYNTGAIIDKFPTVIKDIEYGNNKTRPARVSVGKIKGDVYANEFYELFPSTEGSSTIQSTDVTERIECVLETEASQSFGQNASTKIGFGTVRDTYSMYDSSTDIITATHGGRVRIDFQGTCYGMGLNYIAIGVAGVDTTLLKGSGQVIENKECNYSYSTEVAISAGNEIYASVRNINNAAANIELLQYARLSVTYL